MLNSIKIRFLRFGYKNEHIYRPSHVCTTSGWCLNIIFFHFFKKIQKMHSQFVCRIREPPPHSRTEPNDTVSQRIVCVCFIIRLERYIYYGYRQQKVTFFTMPFTMRFETLRSKGHIFLPLYPFQRRTCIHCCRTVSYAPLRIVREHACCTITVYRYRYTDFDHPIWAQCSPTTDRPTDYTSPAFHRSGSFWEYIEQEQIRLNLFFFCTSTEQFLEGFHNRRQNTLQEIRTISFYKYQRVKLDWYFLLSLTTKFKVQH